MGKHTKEGYSVDALAALMKGQYDELTGRSAVNNWRPSKVPSLIMPKNTVPKSVPTQKITRKNGNLKDRGFGSLYEFENYKTQNMMAETQRNLQMANDLMEAASKISQAANPVDKGFPNSINDAFKAPEKKELPSLFEKAQNRKPKTNNPYEVFTKTETKTPTKEEVDKALVGRVGKDQLNFSDIKRQDNEESQKKKAQDQAAKELVMQLDFQREIADNPLVNPNAKPKQTAPINAVTEASKAKAEHDKEAQMRAMETASRSRNPYELSSEPTPVDPEDRPWYAVRKALGVPYEVSDRDTTYDRDLDEYYVSKSPKIREMIKNKYHWSDDEFNSRYDDYQKDRGYNEALEDAATASVTGREYPVGSSVYTAMMTPAVSLEGINATVDGLINNDERSLTHNLHSTMQKQALRGATSEKVGEDFGDVGKFAYDAGMNLADQAVMTAMGGKAGLGLMSGQIAGQGTNEALQRGIDPRKAALTGFAQGGVSLPLNLIGFDVALGKGINAGGNAVVKSLIQPTTGAIKGIGQAALSEGLEEIVEEGANKLTDVLINQDKSALLSDYSNYKAQGMSENDAWLQVAKDFGIDLAQAGLTGAAFGAVIRGYHEGASRVVPEVEAFAAEKLAEHKFKKNEDIRRIVKGELPIEEPRVPDVVENAQRQAEQARAEVERLNQQIPNPTGEVGEIPEDFDNEQSYEAWRQKLIEDARNKAEINAPVGESASNPMQNVDFKPVIHNADGQLLDTVKVPEYSADNDVFFNGSDTDIAFAEAQDAAITDTFKNIVSDPEFNALSFKNGRQEVYVSPSTTGTGYRMSYTVDGVPTGHHDYSANEIDALSQNLREMAGNGGEDIRIQRKSDITSQNEAAPINAEQPNINTKTEQPDVAEIPEPQEVNPYQFQGEELENAKKTYKKNRDTIRTLKQNIEVIEGDKSNYHGGKLKKDAKARIKAINDQIKSLETENKPLYRGIHGKKTPVKELISRNDYNYIYDYRTQGSIEQDINYMVNYAGKTPEAVQMGKDLKKLVDDLVETGDLDLVREIWDKAVELEDLARATDAEYTKSVAKHVTDAFGEERNTLAESIITSKAIDHAFDALQKQKAELNNTGIDTNPKITEEVGETAPADIVETASEPQATPVNQVPEVVNQETQPVNQPVNEVPTVVNQTQPVPTQEVPKVTEDIGNVPPEPVEVTEGEDNRKTSKLAPHTLRRSDVVTEYEFENDPVVQNLLKYEAHNNETSLKSALENVKKNHDEILNNYLTKEKLIDSDQDVDQAMLLLQELSEKMRAGDDSVRAQRNLLLSRLRRQATKWGQNIQAFAKWNDTADGAMINGERITDQRTKDWESRNQEKKNKNEKVAETLAQIPATVEYDGVRINNGANYQGNKVNPNQSNVKLDNALKRQGYDGTMDIPKEPKTIEQLRKEVRKSLLKEYGSIEDKFSNADIDYLANLISEGATTDELTSALNTKMATGAFGISAETQARVNSLFDYASRFDPDSQEAIEAKAAAYKLIADEVVGKATPFERFEAWRYLAMLGNPKTMIRNFVGNMTFNVVTDVSNSLAGVLEAGTDYAVRGGKAASNKLFGTDFDTSHGINRTKSLLLPTKADKALVKGAWGDSVAHKYNEMTGSKYDDTVQNKIRQQKSVFNSKWAQLYEKVTDAGISDTAAVRAKYSTSLAGYMKANGMDASMFDADERFRALEYESRRRKLTDSERSKMESLRSDHDALEKARDYAVQEAEYATFHEDNKVAQLLSEFSTKARNSNNAVAKGIGYIFEGVMPFKKTPANIVRSGYDFSPFGAISSIAKTGKLIYESTGHRKKDFAETYTTKSGNVVNRTLASDVIESWARNLTGAGMLALGYYLTNKGILNSSNKDELYQDELEGKQNYSITINGHTYTIDGAAPASMSLLMGAELHKIVERNAIPGKKVYENVGDVIGTINSLIDPVVETSMMQGVKNTLETAASVARYDDNAGAGLGVLGTMAANAGLNYVSQVVPTILGQAARVIDPVRRSTDTVSPNSFVAGMEKQGRKMMNKFPFLSMLNNPYVNARGEQELNSPSANPLVSIPYQFISPGYLQEINQTEADKSARGVYNAGVPDDNGNIVPQMDNGVFETWKSKVTVGEHKFTPDEMYQYRTTAGQANEEIRTALARSDWFNELSPQKQNDLLKSVNTFVDKLGKDALGYDQDDKALDIYKNGGKNAVPDLLEYYKEKAVSSQVTEQTGLSSSTNASKAIVEDAKAGDMQAVEQKIDAAAQIINYGYERPSYIVDTYYKAQKTFPQLTVDQFIQEFNEIAGQEGSKESVSQDEIINYANKKKLPLSQVQQYWTAYGKSNWKQVPYVMDDGTIGKKKK